MLKEQEMQTLKQIAKGVAEQFGSNCEVVIHEITEKSAYSSIVAIYNGHVTGRKLGDGPSHVVLEQLGSRRSRSASPSTSPTCWMTSSASRWSWWASPWP